LNCFGIFALSITEEIPFSSLDELCKGAVGIAKGGFKEGTFAVRGKSFVKGVSSKQLEEALGRIMLDTFSNMKVRLKDPEQEIHCILYKDRAYIYFNSVEGAKGMPLSSQGSAGLIVSANSKPADVNKIALGLMKCGAGIVFVTDSKILDFKELEKFNSYKPIKCISVSEAKGFYEKGDLLAFFSLAKSHKAAEIDSKLIGVKAFAPLILE
jgi:hypothetical protein